MAPRSASGKGIPSLFDAAAEAPFRADADVSPDARTPEPHYKGHRDRLRKRLMDSGPESFPDYELLELLLFYSVERVDVKPLAKRLIATFGSLGGVLAASPEQLLRHERVSERTIVHLKALREISVRLLRERVADRPVVSSWQQLLDYCHVAMADEGTERFRLLFLDRKNRIIRDEVQQQGTVDHTPVYPREVIKRALDLGACALILVHNHPSGDPTPSQADIAMTQEIRDIGAKLGITLYDHVIVAKGGTRSFRQLGLL
ncbi:MAG: JAB domain-containing protein [Rhodospirillales bacterium]|nr:MAG: JAB domain-containing protein [Rhodospirillales bacterium]